MPSGLTEGIFLHKNRKSGCKVPENLYNEEATAF